MKAAKAALFAIVLYGGIAAIGAEPAFDAPLDVRSPAEPPGNGALTCFVYKNFVVKQIDDGDVGAKVSVVPVGVGATPSCRPEQEPAEFAIESANWAGYFKGARGNYLFLEAAKDGGALGFAIFAGNTALFEDASVGGVQSATLTGPALTVRYARSISAGCSIPRDGAACWSRIVAATGLDPDRPPDCAAPYQAAMDEARNGDDPAAADATLWTDVPSVIAYEAEVTVGAGAPAIRPIGNATGCRPAD
jgi:hypothetical protein